MVVVVVVDDDGGDDDVVVVVSDEVAGGVTTTVLDLPGSPLGPSGPGAPVGPCGPGVGTGTTAVDGGVLTTPGGFVTTVGRSQAIRPIDAKSVANNSVDFIALSNPVNLTDFQSLRESRTTRD